MSSYLSSNDVDDKKDSLIGLLNKNALKDETLNQIEDLVKENRENKITFVQILCKYSYEKAKPYLLALADTDLLSFFKFIYWYAKGKCNQYLNIIEQNVNKIDDEGTFRFCTYVLAEINIDYGKLIVPFTKYENEKIRAQAIYSLGELQNKKDYINTFIEALNDTSNQVIHTTLQALSGVKDERLLDHYKKIAERFPVEQDNILVNLNYRLAEYGLDNQTILSSEAETDTNPINSHPKKKWYEIWK